MKASKGKEKEKPTKKVKSEIVKVEVELGEWKKNYKRKMKKKREKELERIEEDVRVYKKDLKKKNNKVKVY